MASVRELTGSSLPSSLFDLPEPPKRLYVVGDLPVGPYVAIVGTRTPTPAAAAYARSLAAALAAQGVVIASGGAQGIDTEAHLGALEASGATVVVAPSSFDRPYPAENRALFERIVSEGGAFISAYGETAPPQYAQFFARNGYLVALSQVLVIVETRLRGGARNAAKKARQLQRPLFVVPATPWNPVGSGCIAELKRGARLLASPRDVLRLLAAQNAPHLPGGGAKALEQLNLNAPGTDGQAASSGPRSCPSGSGKNTSHFKLPGALGRVAACFEGRPLYPDEVCLRTGLPASRVQALLLTLTLKGVLVCEPSGQFALPK